MSTWRHKFNPVEVLVDVGEADLDFDDFLATLQKRRNSGSKCEPRPSSKSRKHFSKGRAACRALAGERVEDVGHRGDSAGERNILARKSQRISGTVPLSWCVIAIVAAMPESETRSSPGLAPAPRGRERSGFVCDRLS